MRNSLEKDKQIQSNLKAFEEERSRVVKSDAVKLFRQRITSTKVVCCNLYYHLKCVCVCLWVTQPGWLTNKKTHLCLHIFAIKSHHTKSSICSTLKYVRILRYNGHTQTQPTTKEGSRDMQYYCLLKYALQ